MTLKPNYLLAFVNIFLRYFVLVAVVLVIARYFQSQKLRIGDVISLAALGGAVCGIFAVIFLTPREITWDDETIMISAFFPGSGYFDWRQFEAWCPVYGRGTFVLKFEGKQTFQIAPAAFHSKDWKTFRSFLQRRFPEKKTSSWFCPTSVRFRKRQ